uniref:Ataxin-10 n=1 Tax=Anthurium amnicola TaxID=1678845 RepID=A0A1D1Z1X1_9ARAE
MGLLSDILSEHFYRGSISSDFALSILRVLKEASRVVDFTSRGTSPLPTGSPAVDVLGYSLTILRDICASDDFSSPASERLVDSLVSSGICPFLLDVLRDLEPPSTIRKILFQRAMKESPSISSNSSKVCPYKGFRRDIVAVIGNCTCGRKHVQDEIRHQNGILLLLQQCVIDEDQYLREWGMLTVSYLLEGNMENQQQVTELELQGSVDTPEIANLGLKVDVDKKTGRVKLVNA